MKIAVGSTNPVKVKAVKNALKSLYSEVEFVSLAVDPGVPDQPMGDKQTITGAINRAQKALKESQGDLAVGLEGGLIHTQYGLMSSAWCAVVDKSGKLGLGGGMHFQLPEKIAQEIDKGKELGEVMDELTGKKDLKRKTGAVGVLTKGLLSRAQVYANLVQLAIVKFRSPEWFV